MSELIIMIATMLILITIIALIISYKEENKIVKMTIEEREERENWGMWLKVLAEVDEKKREKERE